MHVLKSMGNMEAPIKDLNYREVFIPIKSFQKYERIWQVDGSLRTSLIEVIQKLDESE